MRAPASERPLISVIIPTHDRAPLLQRSLESLREQSLPPSRFEVVVVDDGSSDATGEVSMRLGQDLKLRYHRIENSGIAAAKNLGLFASQAPISFFFDDDDVADPGLLQAHLAGHDDHPEENVVILGYTTWAPELEVTPVMRYVTDIGQHLFAYRNLRDGQVLDFTYFWGGRASCKRSFLVQHGSFNQDLRAMEDIELAYRLSKHRVKVVHKRAARSFMVRPITFDDFCRRCEGQGRALWRFNSLHEDPVVQRYAGVERALTEWPATSDLLEERAAAVRDLEARLPAGDLIEELLPELHELYKWTFEAFRAKGIVEAARADGVEAAEGRQAARAHEETAQVVAKPVLAGSRPPSVQPSASASLPVICPDPIFIIGSPRSGTSILAWSLAEHSQLRTEAESDILFYLLGRGHVEEAFEISLARPDGTWLSNHGVDHKEFLRYLGLGLNALFTSRSEGKRWVDQTPVYTLMVDVLADLFPGAYFLHILRDGPSVVNSMINFAGTFRDPTTAAKMEEAGRLPRWASNFQDACRAWARFVRISTDFCAQNPDRALTVRNEHLVEDAEGGFREILEFIGAAQEDGPARFFRTHRINSSFSGNVQREGPPRQDDAWTTWTPQQRAIFTKEAGKVMVKAGLGSPDAFAEESR